MSDEKTTIGRRNVLKTLGIGAIGVQGLASGAIATKADHQKLDEIVNRANRIRERTGKRKPFITYLKRKGVQVFEDETHTTIYHRTDGPSTTALDTYGDVAYYMTLMQYSCEPNYCYIDFEYEITDLESYDKPENPMDLASVHWANDYYDRVNDSETTGPYSYVGQTYGDLDENGISVEWANVEQDYHNDPPFRSWFNVKTYVRNTDIPDNTRIVTFDYRHFYDKVEVTGISVGSGGVSYSISESEKQWKWNDDRDWSQRNQATCGP